MKNYIIKRFQLPWVLHSLSNNFQWIVSACAFFLYTKKISFKWFVKQLNCNKHLCSLVHNFMIKYLYKKKSLSELLYTEGRFVGIIINKKKKKIYSEKEVLKWVRTEFLSSNRSSITTDELWYILFCSL